MPRRKQLFWAASSDKLMLRTNHKVGRRQLADVLKGAGKDFTDLVRTMLVWDPALRPEPATLLRHRFFAEYAEGLEFLQ